MQQYRKNLGKVSLTAEGPWDGSKRYEILSIVYDEHTQHGFISKKEVPSGVDLYNAEYWMPLNVSGFVDNNIIILSKKTSDASIQSYTLEEAVKSIPSVGRRPGSILGFYNLNTDRLDIGGRWELWQYNAVDVANWENLSSWQNIYYNFNKFVGWYRSEEALKKYIPFPEIGCYAYVGSDLNEAVIYRCDRKYAWTNTTEHVWDYIKVIVGGNVTVGENGNWFNNGVDTNIPASIKGENGKTPIIRNNNNILEVSYDNVTWTKVSDEMAAWFRINNNKLEMSRHEAGGWEVMSDYIAAWFRWQSQGGQQAFSTGKIQITRDGVTWTDLSGEFVNNLRISRYIGTDESLPTSGIAEGTIYAKGPYYEDTDTNHDYPAYRIWVYAWKGNTLAWIDHGQFTSIAAGIVQETGDSEVAVMSQKAVTEKLSELGQKVEGVTIQFNELDYKQVSKFNIGEKIRIKVIEAANGYANFFGKTSLSDSSFQAIGICKVGQTIEFTSDREINYIKAYNSENQKPIVIEVEKTDSLSVKLKGLESLAKENSISISESFVLNVVNDSYIEIPNLKKGGTYKIEVIDLPNGAVVAKFGKKNFNDENYTDLNSVNNTISDDVKWLKVYIQEGVSYPLNIRITKVDAICRTTPRYCMYSGIVSLYTDRVELKGNGVLSGNGKEHVLDSTMNVLKTDEYNNHYIILNMDTLEHRLLRSSSFFDLDEREAVLCLVRWNQGFIWCNCPTIEYGDIKISPKSIANLELKTADIEAEIRNTTLTYNALDYLKVPTIPVGGKARITFVSSGRDINISLFGKTSLSDSSYQPLGSCKLGESIEFTSEQEINYIKVYNTQDIVPIVIRLGLAESLATRIEVLESHSSYTPCMYNPSIDFKKTDFKIFDIGNSYTQDAQYYLPNIVEASGLENNYSIYRAFRASGSFKSWVDCWNNKDNQTYHVVKCVGKDIDGIGGSGNVNDGAVFRNALTSVKWDVILIHQVSVYANNFRDWSGKGNGGYLKELIQIIRKTNPQATIGFLLVHSYRSGYDSNTEGSSLKRWENIVRATQDLKNAYGVDFIIPYGTAVQNLRASSLSDEFEFSEDGTHLADGLGDYVASCCYYQSLLAPRFGVSILGNTFSCNDIDESIGGRKAITPERALVAQKAAMLAAYNMWEVMNPDDYDL